MSLTRTTDPGPVILDEKLKSFFRTPSYYRRARESAEERRSKRKAIRGEALRRVNYEMCAAGVDHPPADLVRLAQHLGISEIKVVPLSMRARLITQGGKLVAEVNEKLDRFSRQRSLAHELAHVVLERDRISLASTIGSNVRRSGANGLIEQLCDLCGDEMLLPREWLGKRLEHPSASLASIMEVASQADLPIDFVLKRVIELELKPWRALWFQKNQEEMQILKSEPKSDDTFLAWIEVERDPNSPLSKCWEAHGITQGKISLKIDGKTERYTAECAKIREQVALSLLYLGQSAPPAKDLD